MASRTISPYRTRSSAARPLDLLFTLLLAAAACLTPAHAQIVEVGDGGPGPFKAEHLTAELTTLSPQAQAMPGGTLQAGLVLTLEEHWHVYWTNPGDSGEPPRITWTLPRGITASPLLFTPPEPLPLGPLKDFGYEDQAVFPFTIKVDPSAAPGKVHLDAKVSWLVCESVCVPGKAHLGLDINIVKGPVQEPALLGALGNAVKALPRPLPSGWSVTATGGSKDIFLTLHSGTSSSDIGIYPFDQDVIDIDAPDQRNATADGWQLWLPRPKDSTALPRDFHVLIEFSDKEAYDVTVPVTPGEPPAVAASSSAPGAAEAPSSDIGLWGALGLALLGGIILNLMPCVFPVLFLKGLALVNSSGEERSRQRMHGLVYTLGILASFWTIVAVLLILRAGGRQLGWGFQLQSPGFVAVLAALIFFLALSLTGQFEIGLSLTSAGGELAEKQGLAGSFFTGVLATVVATPCMAPLMGAAVGFALAQPPVVTFLVFTMLGLGLALPYLALTMQPQWTRVLPRPGAWMDVLKQATSIPLFATAIWLTWVYGQLYSPNGVDRIVPLLSGFLLLAIGGWFLGRWPGQTKGLLIAAPIIVLAILLPLRKPTVEKLQWQPWTPASFAAARTSGKPIFVDYTAAWCLSCQVNERAVLDSTDIEALLGNNNFILLRADWTQYDANITQSLQTLGRSGVPTYVIYPPGDKSNPDVLPELLTKDLVTKQIDKDLKLSTKN
ncbi:thiol:disulfide interchange protein DsbD [Bryocella elongata]|uniref:Thiol:disulfide interchange protein DsbD n=1 Tax=Bryocella elongata TaxID=863522 RepID=A0A1H5TZL5_9BACT|nr:thioredoxin family protein [Bryocella elongata]SEF68190.1 thiol:disulfide interchange protein DsbD [Bryocella elongata]